MVALSILEVVRAEVQIEEREVSLARNAMAQDNVSIAIAESLLRTTQVTVIPVVYVVGQGAVALVTARGEDNHRITCDSFSSRLLSVRAIFGNIN